MKRLAVIALATLAAACSKPEPEGELAIGELNCPLPAAGANTLTCSTTLTATGLPVLLTEISSQTAPQVMMIGGNGPFQTGPKGELVIPPGSHPVTFQFGGVSQFQQVHLKVVTKGKIEHAVISALDGAASGDDSDSGINVNTNCPAPPPGANAVECILTLKAYGAANSLTRLTSGIGGDFEAWLLLGEDEISQSDTLALPADQDVRLKVRLTNLPRSPQVGDRVSFNAEFGSGAEGELHDVIDPPGA